MDYFTVKEMKKSHRAELLGISNEPNTKQRFALLDLIDKVLTPARIEYGKPIRVTSGFRSAELNKAVGGATCSQHCKGEAADLRCVDNARLFAILRKQGNFDQLIWEFGDAIQPDWVHVSYSGSGKQRGEVLRSCKHPNGKVVYLGI